MYSHMQAIYLLLVCFTRSFLMLLERGMEDVSCDVGSLYYSVEAFTLPAQYYYIPSERMHMQLIWNKTINVHGHLGKNTACDLHMEHLNRECKGSNGSLGPMH